MLAQWVEILLLKEVEKSVCTQLIESTKPASTPKSNSTKLNSKSSRSLSWAASTAHRIHQSLRSKNYCRHRTKITLTTSTSKFESCFCKRHLIISNLICKSILWLTEFLCPVCRAMSMAKLCSAQCHPREPEVEAQTPWNLLSCRDYRQPPKCDL